MKIGHTGDLLPGDIGFSTIPGHVGGWVSLGQAVLRDSCRFTHAYLVLDRGQLIEAMPSGARIMPLAARVGPGYAYGRLPMAPDVRAAVAAGARTLEGVRYSFADYAALGLNHLGVPTPLLRRYISRSSRMICSQLVDHALCRFGDVHLFNDGRLHQDVTPGDLFYQVGALGEIMWW